MVLTLLELIHSSASYASWSESGEVESLGGACCQHSEYCQPLFHISSSAYGGTIHTLAKARKVKHLEILLSNKVIMLH